MILTAAVVAALLRAALLWRGHQRRILAASLTALAGLGLVLFGIDAHLDPVVALSLGLGVLGTLAAPLSNPAANSLGLCALAGQGAGLAFAFWQRGAALADLGLPPAAPLAGLTLGLLALFAALVAMGRLGAIGATAALLALALGLALMVGAATLLPANPGQGWLLAGAGLLCFAALLPGTGPVPLGPRPGPSVVGWLAFWVGQALVLFGSLFYWYHPAA